MATTGYQPRNASGGDEAQAAGFFGNPWVQIVAGIICMAMIANLQYGWTVFVNPLHDKFGWEKAAIQVSFTIFVLLETWLVPVETFLADRFGPRWVVFAGGIFTALAWVVDGNAHSLPALYFGGALAGIGGGLVYGTCVGNAIKWFGKRRGLAAGLTAAGFGAGAAFTVIPLTLSIKANGPEATFITYGLAQGIVILIFSMLLRKPPASITSAPQATNLPHTNRDHTPGETLASPVFWVMYVAFVLVAAGGLMGAAQLGPIAKDFNIANIPISFIGIVLPTLTFALALNNIMNGLTRPLLGWISDHVGREITMFFAFLAEGIGILLLKPFGQSPVSFVILAGIVFFAWGEIFSLFPSTTRDHFGQKYASTNYGMLYTAKGTAAFFVPIASILKATSGSWALPLAVAGIANIVAAFIILLVLKPLRLRELAREEQQVRARTAPAV